MKVSLFSNGKMSVTGARSLLSAAVALEKVARALRRRVNKNARVCNITCTNMLVAYNFGHHVICQLFEKSCKGSIYDPFRFSGVRVRVPINTPQRFFTPLALLQMANLNGKYTNFNGDYDEATDATDDESIESSADSFTDDDITPPAFVDINEPYTIAPKSNIQKLVGDFNNKRKIHQSPRSQFTKKRTKVVSSSVWSTKASDIHVKDLKGMKSEFVTVNVFTSGNITFTGARSITSVQSALSYIYPHLCSSKANNFE